MALVDRLSRVPPEPADGWLHNHAFSAAIYLWAQGVVTRTQLVTGLGLTATDEVQLDQMKSSYDGLTANQKLAFHGKVESLGVLLEEQLITPAFYKTVLGLT